jgi:glycosyltransferase involved in cell wall biosynthesis
MGNHKISAYVPCFNNASTIGATLQSILDQKIEVAELFVIDDGSIDESCLVAKEMGIPVFKNERNLGRGAVRARAMELARGDLVLCCDATKVLSSDFLEKAILWFADPEVAGVYGGICQPPARNVVQRWRGRHLFKDATSTEVRHNALLVTAGLLISAEAVRKVGNYDLTRCHTEDGDLGERLLKAGYDVVNDPKLRITCTSCNTLWQVLERYWRWHAGKDEAVSWKAYLKQVVYSIKVMARQDLRDRDTLSVPISLFSPHYQFWRSFVRSWTAGQVREETEIKSVSSLRQNART